MDHEQGGLTERELDAWQTFFLMQEVVRARIEQQLQACGGLSNADYTVLAVLSEAPDRRLRIFQMGAALGWEKSRLHHQITRMCGRGLVERQRGDARAIHVALTPRGHAALAEAAPAHSRHVRELVIDRLTPAQIDQLAAISHTILDGLRGNAPETGEDGEAPTDGRAGLPC
ncbi:MarR family winged helix-turn-helix transcriptional regulator [Plantactinospora sp. B24E8]|uniref:MarR family winged helix-turn-helix transcriptional regulator n=1 Tax=Plantactinospora sp. B24E8 TaxID=3153567 RepID=UPI00325CCAD7